MGLLQVTPCHATVPFQVVTALGATGLGAGAITSFVKTVLESEDYFRCGCSIANALNGPCINKTLEEKDRYCASKDSASHLSVTIMIVSTFAAAIFSFLFIASCCYRAHRRMQANAEEQLPLMQPQYQTAVVHAQPANFVTPAQADSEL